MLKKLTMIAGLLAVLATGCMAAMCSPDTSDTTPTDTTTTQ
jgi:hypothetical protein